MEYLAMIWDAYGRSAEYVFNLIHELAPEAHLVAFIVAVLWPFLIALVVLMVITYTHDWLTMRRIRRDIARRTHMSRASGPSTNPSGRSTLRDRSN